MYLVFAVIDEKREETKTEVGQCQAKKPSKCSCLCFD